VAKELEIFWVFPATIWSGSLETEAGAVIRMLIFFISHADFSALYAFYGGGLIFPQLWK
jgi:hypothetical protein